MTDATINRFLARGTAADRAAFVPNPATPASGPLHTYLWYETDTGDTYAWDGADWQQVNNGAGATIAWGDLTGVLSDQTDLQTALDAKTTEAYADAGDAATLASAQSYADAGDATAEANANDYTDAAIAGISGSGEGVLPNAILSGLGIAYTPGSLQFAISAGVARIDGVEVSVAAQTVTLDAADATNPRIDLLVVDDTGTFGKITGTAATNPSEPQYDPGTQLRITFVLVPATATDLDSGITTETVYDEGTEWTTTASGSGWTVGSTNNPNAGTKCIEGTSVTSDSYFKSVRLSSISFDGDGNLLFPIRSKASWNAKRSLSIQFLLAGVAKGSPITVKNGSFGYDSSNTTSYQTLVIPKSLFAIPAGTSIDELRCTAAGTGGAAIGCYIDPIKLQTTGTTTGGGTVSGITQTQADARYLQRSNNLSDVSSAATSRSNLGATTVGGNMFTLANPSAIRFLRVNADNTVTPLDAASFRTAIGAGVGGGDLVSTNNLSDLANAATARTNLGLGSIAVMAEATAAQIIAGTASKAVSADKLHDAHAPGTLTDGATTTWDMSTAINAKWTVGGARTLAVSNPKVGLTYVLEVIQDGTGSRTVTWPSSFNWGSAGAPTLSTTAAKVDLVTLYCRDAATPKFRAVFNKDS